MERPASLTFDAQQKKFRGTLGRHLFSGASAVPGTLLAVRNKRHSHSWLCGTTRVFSSERSLPSPPLAKRQAFPQTPELSTPQPYWLSFTLGITLHMTRAQEPRTGLSPCRRSGFFSRQSLRILTTSQNPGLCGDPLRSTPSFPSVKRAIPAQIQPKQLSLILLPQAQNNSFAMITLQNTSGSPSPVSTSSRPNYRRINTFRELSSRKRRTTKSFRMRTFTKGVGGGGLLARAVPARKRTVKQKPADPRGLALAAGPAAAGIRDIGYDAARLNHL